MSRQPKRCGGHASSGSTFKRLKISRSSPVESHATDHDLADSKDPTITASPELHLHAVQSILAFSDLRGLSRAACVSKLWKHGVEVMPPIRAEVVMHKETDSRFLTKLCCSTVARHVDRLEASYYEASVDRLSLLWARMPQLCYLYCTLNMETGPFMFPSHLRELKFWLPNSDDKTSKVRCYNAILDGVALVKSLQHLELEFGGVLPTTLNFDAFTQLPQLHTLNLNLQGDLVPELDLSDAQIDALRAVPQLRSIALNSGHVKLPVLEQLLRVPHSLRWQSLRLCCTVLTAAHATALARLPSLTVLEPDHFALSDLSFMHQLPGLTALDVNCAPIPEGPTITALVGTLSSLKNLTRLSVHHDRLTSVHLTQILQGLTQLDDLQLWKCDALESLDSFQSGPVAQSLRMLYLSRCRHPSLTPAALLQLRDLTNLERLEIDEALSAPLDAMSLAVLTPNPTSSLIPSLKKFKYYRSRSSAP